MISNHETIHDLVMSKGLNAALNAGKSVSFTKITFIPMQEDNFYVDILTILV